MTRSTYYYHKKRIGISDGYDPLRAQICTIYHELKGRYGYRRITSELHNQNKRINHKTVLKLMNGMELKGKRKRQKYRSYKGELGKIAANVINRDFRASAPNQKWTTDVTQVKIKDKWLYLSPILDMYKGEIVSYSISHTPDLKMVLDMVDKAFKKCDINGGLVFWLVSLLTHISL